MDPRLNYTKLNPDPLKTMYALEAHVRGCGLEHALLELVKTRASQLNGCAYCLDMHTKDARAAGETEQRLYTLSAWRETPFYTERERAALAWTETVTRIADGVSDEAYEEARRHFTEQELADLTWAVVAINVWNRLAISFRAVPGTYRPQQRAQPAAAASAS